MATPPKPWPINQEQRRREAQELAQEQQVLTKRLKKARTPEEHEHIVTKIELLSVRIEMLMKDAKREV